MLRKTLVMLLILAGMPAVGRSQAPALPEGLSRDSPSKEETVDRPTLPKGLDDNQAVPAAEPDLPAGLASPSSSVSSEADHTGAQEAKWQLPPGLGGFWEVRGGVRVKDDPVQDEATLAETRFQLAYDRSVADYLPRGRLGITTDFLFDAADEDRGDIDLETGEGFIDLREFWISLTPFEFLDLKVGRQILTWGTGNLIFLNDLFPKDYPSFFLGRHLDYLKAPSDALKASFYSALANLDVVYTPRFDADRYVSGRSVSFYDPTLGGLRGEDEPIAVDRPDKVFEDDEIALRLYRNIGAYELALYGYDGFWKGPAGTDPATGKRTFPPLRVLGASVRGPLGPGIGNLEVAWYRSRDDTDGDDPRIQNSELRLLAGYEFEAARNLTVGIQYYLEHMRDYEAYKDGLAPGFPAREENRQWVTLDLTQELMAQNQLVVSLFTFYSLETRDAYLRPSATYDYTDHWQLEVGGNVFLGGKETFFGRLEENTNVYAALRYSF